MPGADTKSRTTSACGVRVIDLLDGLDLALTAGDGASIVTDLTDDSRTVTPGCLFVARPGTQADGRHYIADAVRRGAVAVVTEKMPTDPPDPKVAWVVGTDLNQALAGRLAERFWRDPSRRLRLIGVTGTNGKTTTAFLVQHLLRRAGLRCGLMGTVFLDDGRTRVRSPLTTPGAVHFSRHLAAMVRQGCRAAVVELSSHGIEQGRSAALHFDVGVFTNLTGDHLDYHANMDNYASAKAKLFEQLDPQGSAVVNIDDPSTPRMLRECRARVVRCGLTSNADFRAKTFEAFPDHTWARFDGPWGQIDARLPLIGAFNVSNALLAVAAAGQVIGSQSRDTGDLQRDLEACPPVPGRLERVTAKHKADRAPVVLVDYAHTHDALRNVLAALRPLVADRGALAVLFGCGGDRDRTKRPKMAAAACEFADQIVITSDNPRTEDPQRIIDEILNGVPPEARQRVQVEPNRGHAIRNTIAHATDQDLVLLAGKGHENYQEIGTVKHAFDDRKQAAAALELR